MKGRMEVQKEVSKEVPKYKAKYAWKFTEKYRSMIGSMDVHKERKGRRTFGNKGVWTEGRREEKYRSSER